MSYAFSPRRSSVALAEVSIPTSIDEVGQRLLSVIDSGTGRLGRGIQEGFAQGMQESLPKLIDASWPAVERNLMATIDRVKSEKMPSIMDEWKKDVLYPTINKFAVGGVLLVAAMAGAAYYARKRA